jgi:3-phosphoshikimate 1-carboxyvinyltransferase
MKLHCDIQLPASKSESNRVLMIAAYGGFAPDCQNLSDSNDTLVLANALSEIQQSQAAIDIADSGTAARFLTTFLSCRSGSWLLTGTERMKQRPIKPLVEALRRLGANIQYAEKEGFLPLKIEGKPIQGGKVQIDMSQSSQFASSLLLAAPTWPQGLEMEMFGDLSSLPYLNMTLVMMRHFSAQVERDGRTIIVKPQPYHNQLFIVEPDWSAASYWYEMAMFSEECEIKLKSLSLSKGRANLQGDTIIADWMSQLGVGTYVENDAIVLRKIPLERHTLNFDFSQHPDLYPTMAATCAGLNVEATFTGLDNLALKESNRVEAMQTELAKLGNPSLHFCAHNDHRVVMALAPLALHYGSVTFDHPEVVEKSYPNFWKDASFLPVVFP